jgi:hypothetical protein
VLEQALKLGDAVRACKEAIVQHMHTNLAQYAQLGRFVS